MNVATVITAGEGRMGNLRMVLKCLAEQVRRPETIVLVADGFELVGDETLHVVSIPKHEPGDEQPRNVGVRHALRVAPDTTHVWFLDSDIIVEPDCLKWLMWALESGDPRRTIVAPYDWLPESIREPWPDLHNDPRWAMFMASAPSRRYEGDLSAGLACFGGNLLWDVGEFQRVGGFWNELHHGRCEDGELGLRAVAMGVPIGFCAAARGWHLWHPRNHLLALERNQRDVPMLNARHPWVQGSGVFMVDRDGKAFGVTCPSCGAELLTNEWWAHAEACGVDMRISA